MKSFGKYKNAIDNILAESYTDKKLFKENFHIVMGAMKFSREFREFFTLYNEIEQKNITEEKYAKEYINESIDLLRSKVSKLKKNLPIFDSIISRKLKNKKLESNTIYESLDYLIFKTGIKSIDKRINSKKTLVESLKNNSTGLKLKKGLSPKILAKTLANTFNNEFKNLNESEKKLFDEVISLDNKNISLTFDKEKKGILENINSLINETKEQQVLTRLVETKNTILTMGSNRKNLLSIKQLSQDLN